jgi:hypothetical protein
MKKIGIIGSVIVAKMLATGLNRHGYVVMLGSNEMVLFSTLPRLRNH